MAYYHIINILSNFVVISFKNKNINILFLLEIVKILTNILLLKQLIVTLNRLNYEIVK